MKIFQLFFGIFICAKIAEVGTMAFVYVMVMMLIFKDIAINQHLGLVNAILFVSLINAFIGLMVFMHFYCRKHRAN